MLPPIVAIKNLYCIVPLKVTSTLWCVPLSRLGIWHYKHATKMQQEQQIRSGKFQRRSVRPLFYKQLRPILQKRLTKAGMFLEPTPSVTVAQIVTS